MEDSSVTPHTISVTLKKQLIKFLSDNDMTAAQLARKSGVSKQVLSTWLNGASPRNIEQVKKVADVVGCSIDQLCFAPPQGDMQSPKYTIPDEWLSGIFEIKVRRITK